MTYKTKFSLFTAIFLWASAFVGIRAVLKDYSPEGLALLRYIIASLCMGVIYFSLKEKNKINIYDMIILMVIGAVGIGIYNITLNHGELSISSGMASFIISQAPIMTAILAMIFLGEQLSLFRVIGFVISILGILLITLGEQGYFHWDNSIGYILIATLAGALYSVFQKPFLKKYHVIEVTTYLIWGGTLFLLMYASHLKEDLLHAHLKSTLMVAYLGIFPAAIGYIAWSYALSEIPASRAVSFLYFTPFVTTLLGWVWLSEVPVLLSILGGILAIFGVWLVNRSYLLLPAKNINVTPQLE